MKNQNAEPTVVLYMEGGQIARIVSSHNLRVIVLDGDTAGAGEEDAARLLNVGTDQFYVTDVRVEGPVEKTQVGEQGVDAKYCDGVAKAVEAMAEHHQTRTNVPGAHLCGFPVIESVKVMYWDCYGQDGMAMTHQIDIDDQRLSNGQVYLTVGAIEGDPDDMLSVVAEVNTNPLTGVEHLPCVHVNFDGDGMAFSLFKLNDKILLRTETDVAVSSFVEKVNGDRTKFYLFE